MTNSLVQIPERRLDISSKLNVVVGMIAPYAGSTAPDGWLICDGSAISRTTYAALFSVIGTTYGVGDGNSTFNIPDFQAKVPIGCESNSIYYGHTDNGQLPDIQGALNVMGDHGADIFNAVSNPGCFSMNTSDKMGWSMSTINQNFGKYAGIIFKASGWNSIYGDYTRVRPAGIAIPYVIKY